MGRWWKGVGYALQGIRASLQTEPNLRFHGIAAVVVMTLAAYFGFTRMEWMILLLTIALIISLELLNTAVENVVDLASPKIHPLAKRAKDAAAGAVLMASIFAVFIGILLFYPYVAQLVFGRYEGGAFLW